MKYYILYIPSGKLLSTGFDINNPQLFDSKEAANEYLNFLIELYKKYHCMTYKIKEEFEIVEVPNV